MAYQELEYRVEGKIAYLTLNYPEKLNVLSNCMKAELKDAVGRLEKDDAIWGVIITGAGRAFCAGTDISEFPETPEETRQIVVWTQNIINRIENLNKPVIAVINGLAMGGGLELTLACDIRIASESAKMGLVETKVGAMPCYGGSQRLVRLIGAGKSKELIFTAETITAAEALQLGIVNHVVPDDQALQLAQKIMEKILQNAPLAVTYAKICLNRGAEISLDYAQHLEQQLVSMLVASEDLKEGSQAFLQKRKPVYRKK